MKKILAGAVVSIICLGLVLYGVNWGAVWANLGRVDLPLLGLAMVGVLVAYGLMAWRWRQLLTPRGPRGPLGVGSLFPFQRQNAAASSAPTKPTGNRGGGPLELTSLKSFSSLFRRSDGL